MASLLGLGMAIDYGLFMVGRFREEQAYGATPAEAVARTVATAGRTVLFSATLLMIALAGLLLFPQGFLKSLAYGGLAAVALAAAALADPAARRCWPSSARASTSCRSACRSGRNAQPAGTGWAALADVVLRRPVLVALPIIAGLLVLAAPIRGVQFGEADERVLPAGRPGPAGDRDAEDRLPGAEQRRRPGGAARHRRRRAVGGVRRRSPLRRRRCPASRRSPRPAPAATWSLLTATLRDKDPFSTAARDAVEDIRALHPPPGTEMLVGGTTARNVDSLDATADRLPLMVALLVGATLVLMFLAFGSVLLPIKAVLVSALSLAATFGILVWIFQDGHGAGPAAGHARRRPRSASWC